MKSAVLNNVEFGERSERAHALADRLLEGAGRLAAVAGSLTPQQWNSTIPGDGRTVGVVVHHVASVYPIEIEIATTIAGGQPLTNVTMADVHAMNETHAKEFADVSRDAAIDLLRRNSAAAAEAIRSLTDDDLDRAAPASLYANATVTSQFVLEDHAVRHSFHHLERIERTLATA
jgi:hypothetical protein